VSYRYVNDATEAIVRALLRGVASSEILERFGITGNQLADVRARHRHVLRTGDVARLRTKTKVDIKTSALSSGARRQAEPRRVLPLPPARARLVFGPHTDWYEFEWLRCVRPQRALVPGGVWGGGDRAHRRMEVP